MGFRGLGFRISGFSGFEGYRDVQLGAGMYCEVAGHGVAQTLSRVQEGVQEPFVRLAARTQGRAAGRVRGLERRTKMPLNIK